MNWILEMDQSLFYFINTTITNSIFDIFFPFITDLYKNIFFGFIVYPLLLYLLFRKFGKKSFLIFLYCVFTLAISDFIGNHVFKNYFQRLRPGDNPSIHAIVRAPYGGFSFVSNHATNMFAFSLIMGFFLPGLRRFFYSLAFLVAFSRVYNGVHFPSDVIAGGALGLTISFVLLKLYIRFFDGRKAVIS